MKEYCKLEQNKTLPYLQREEGGLGGNDNDENKQIRFRVGIMTPWQRDDDIIMDQITNGENEIWTYEELDDIIYGFINYANDEIMGCECISGFIELKNKDIDWDERDGN
jgi:hypothetical protein